MPADTALTKACSECDSTNLSQVHGETVAGTQPEGDGPYRCNDCGAHIDPVERPKGHTYDTRRGLAGALSKGDAGDLITDGGEDVQTEWTLTCLDCGFETTITADGHPRDGPPTNVEQRVTRHKHTEDESHVVRVAGRRTDRDDAIDPSLVTDGGKHLAEVGADRRPGIDRYEDHAIASAIYGPLLGGDA